MSVVCETSTVNGTMGENVCIGSFCKIESDVIVGRWAYVKSYTIVREHVPPFTVCGKKGIEGINTGPLRREYPDEIDELCLTYRCLKNGEPTPTNPNQLSQELINFFKEYCE